MIRAKPDTPTMPEAQRVPADNPFVQQCREAWRNSIAYAQRQPNHVSLYALIKREPGSDDE